MRALVSVLVPVVMLVAVAMLVAVVMFVAVVMLDAAHGPPMRVRIAVMGRRVRIVAMRLIAVPLVVRSLRFIGHTCSIPY